jgi:hypothetical protein
LTALRTGDATKKKIRSYPGAIFYGYSEKQTDHSRGMKAGADTWSSLMAAKQ